MHPYHLQGLGNKAEETGRDEELEKGYIVVELSALDMTGLLS